MIRLGQAIFAERNGQGLAMPPRLILAFTEPR